MPEIDAGILVGGQSKRFGQDKATLRFGNTTLLERIYDVLQRAVKTIWVIGNNQGAYGLSSDVFVKDIITNAGPMGGLITALRKTNNPTLLVSCDTPFIELEHVQYLIDNFETKLAGTIALSDKGVEPLFGIYQPHLLPLLDKLVATKNLALYRIFEYEKVKFVDFSKAGYISDLFFNINTLSDYKKALYLRKEILNNNVINSAGGKNG
jgi:molybdopterin-guanine dinucleotide biosynthesis protein A